MATTQDLENRVQVIFSELKDGFNKMPGLSPARQQSNLKELTAKMQEAKNLIKDFEREARMDDMDITLLASRKKKLVQDLNSYISKKKAMSEQAEGMSELVGSKKGGKKPPVGQEGMSTDQLMQLGRKEIASTDAALVRAQKVVADTIDIGTKTAETLDSQTKQLERVMNDLDEIHFSMKKAKQVIRDMTRGMATDKCIRVMLLVVVLGAIALVACRIAGVGNLKRKPRSPPSFSAQSSGRRMQGFLELEPSWS